MFMFACVCALAAAVQTPHWRSEVLFQAPVKLSGCAIGDVDPALPGAEVAAVGGNGGVFVVGRGAEGWTGQEAFLATGEMIQCAIGEVLPDVPGLEIVAVGKAAGAEREPGDGAAFLVSRTEEGWRGERIHGSARLVHGVCIHEGRVYVTGYDQRFVRLAFDGTSWTEEELASLPGPGKNCIPMGDAFVIACSNGSLVRLRAHDGAWQAETIDQREKGRGRVGTDGKRLVVSDDDGVFSLIEDGRRTELLHGSLRQRGAVLADLVPERAGLEMATAGYDRTVRVFWTAGEGFETVAPYTDTERFHHLAVGNLDDDPALELAACSFSGRVVLVEHVSGAP
ncbi:MAG: hypothetical protein HY812_20390 [Planctomycetes bacterium]|nr:hypothetical protein [Planctomycetota bacterium]